MPVLWAVSRSVVQRRAPAQQPGIPAAGPGDDRHAKLAARLRYAPPANQLGRKTIYALTFEVDQSPGAGHRRAFGNLAEIGTVANSKPKSSGELPAIAIGILWIFGKETWRKYPVLASVLVVCMIVTVAALVLEIVVGINSLVSNSTQATVNGECAVPSTVTWHPESKSCDITESFLQQIKNELNCGGIDPLGHTENKALQLRATLQKMRGTAERRYADYFVFYSSPLGGTQDRMSVEIDGDVNAVAGVRIFERMGTQIVATKPVLELSKTLIISTDGAAGIERVVVFVFPLDTEASEFVKKNPLSKFATTLFGEETP